ncbi:hypothetical protein Tcan_15232 [Toxocara canis]|uniref:Uncharacterized protein n=1 Tax=Toxocara canis TaxID=6265 RepID=A0A0B2W070_TOXCA|nr:hypothetical protein Tcan_15232 [Toxocara canis]
MASYPNVEKPNHLHTITSIPCGDDEYEYENSISIGCAFTLFDIVFEEASCDQTLPVFAHMTDIFLRLLGITFLQKECTQCCAD